MLVPQNIKAITLDLDDTLWPIWPTIERAEKVLHAWLAEHAPLAAAMFADAPALREIREEIGRARLDLKHDLSALRREAIRLALERAGEDPALAELAFDVFFAERQRVELYADALPALEWLAARYPLASISNGNADVVQVGLGHLFRVRIHAREFGVAKPDPRIFHAAAQALEVRPEEVLHVGDDASLDALGALEAGMQAAWLNRTGLVWPHARQPHVQLLQLGELAQLLG